jgi:hypothetical protein
LKCHATDTVLEYLELKPWFEELEGNQIRNKHAVKYTQYTDVLVDMHKLFTIEDLVSLTGAELAAVGNMEFGTALRIIRFAKEDAALLERGKKISL